MSDSWGDWPDSDLGELVSRLDGQIASVEEITRLKSPRQRKASFKLVFKDGRAFKARWYVSEEKRCRVTALSPLLDGLPFARIIAARGKVTLEEWIVGTVLNAVNVTNEQAYRSGALLGLVHTRTGIPNDLRADIPDVAWELEKINSFLSAIAMYAPEETRLCEAIAEIARQQQPAAFESGLIHADFCADNMIVTTDGSIVVIDNEQLRVGALDYDLARCWCRWPMTDRQRQAFCGGYEQHRDLDQFMTTRQFWAVRALTLSLVVHLGHGRSNKPVLDALHRLAGGHTDRFWPRLQTPL